MPGPLPSSTDTDAHRSQLQTFRLQLVREGPATPPMDAEGGTTLNDPAEVARLLSPLLTGLDREHFVALALDCRNRPIGVNTVSVGSLSAAIVHPREVFKFAILANAAAIIVAHNHPSGDTTPSQDDIELTRRLMDAGRTVGIEVLDHLIVCDGEWVSLKQEGYI